MGREEKRRSARVLILGGFGHLGGPIMGVFALLEGDCAILFMYIFPTHSNIGVSFSAKLGQKRQFCARMRTNWHAATRKSEWKSRFTHQNALFWQLLRYLLLPTLYTHRQSGTKGDVLLRSNPRFGYMPLVFRPALQVVGRRAVAYDGRPI